MRNCFWFNCFWKLVLMLLSSYVLKLDWLHLEISVLKNFIHPISFSLSCIYMHVLYNDFLNILIIGLNVASHHKQCGSGWLFFFFFINVIGNAIGHWSWQFRWAPAVNQGGLVLDVKLFGHCVWFTGLSLVRYFSFR